MGGGTFSTPGPWASTGSPALPERTPPPPLTPGWAQPVLRGFGGGVTALRKGGGTPCPRVQENLKGLGHVCVGGSPLTTDLLEEPPVPRGIPGGLCGVQGSLGVSHLRGATLFWGAALPWGVSKVIWGGGGVSPVCRVRRERPFRKGQRADGGVPPPCKARGVRPSPERSGRGRKGHPCRQGSGCVCVPLPKPSPGKGFPPQGDICGTSPHPRARPGPPPPRRGGGEVTALRGLGLSPRLAAAPSPGAYRQLGADLPLAAVAEEAVLGHGGRRRGLRHLLCPPPPPAPCRQSSAEAEGRRPAG